MNEYSFTEENYLKTIFLLSKSNNKRTNTNIIANCLDTKPGSVSDMLKKLSAKRLLVHKKYRGVKLTDLGRSLSIRTIRKHRLWEFFLVRKLKFGWDEVHAVAEQLEHIQSAKLTDSLDKFLDFPKYDPHGDPIPNKDGVFPSLENKTLDQVNTKISIVIKGIKTASPQFLKYIEKLDIKLEDHLKVIDIEEFDKSMTLQRDDKKTYCLSALACSNIYVKPQ